MPQFDAFSHLVPARPTERDVVELASRSLLKELQLWEPSISDDDETVMKLLRETIIDCSDGYEAAQRFEHAGFMPDAELVRILDDQGYTTHQFVSEAITAWVVTYEIVPRLSVGATVKVRDLRYKEAASGTITRIDSAQATYTVFVPSWGHKSPDELSATGTSGTTGVIMTYHQLESLNLPKEAE